MTKSLIRSVFIFLGLALVNVCLAQTIGTPDANANAGATKMYFAIHWIAGGLGAFYTAWGLIQAGIKFNHGDPDAMKQVINSVIGGLLIFGAVEIVNMMAGWFK